jgi:hypothetical protein
VPLGVFSIRKYGDEVAEYQQRQDDAAGLFAARKHMIEQRNGENAEAGNAGLGHADHEGAERGENPKQVIGDQLFT